MLGLTKAARAVDPAVLCLVLGLGASWEDEVFDEQESYRAGG